MVVSGMDSPDPPIPAKKGSWRWSLLATLVILIAGMAAGGWVMQRYLASGTAAPKAAPVTASAASQRPADTVPRGAVPLLAAPPSDQAGVLALRVEELERRLSRITMEAESASGNAARAEGLLIAFAARRALDRGLALGYLDAQLRVRFGDAQPNAVGTIIGASRDPATQEDLRARLEDLGPDLIGSLRGGDDWWAAVKRGASELFVVRREGEPSPVASQRLLRAKRLVDGGQMGAAIAEIEALPGKAKAADWLADAKRYYEARRALDLIETAAILEPANAAPAGGMAATAPLPAPAATLPPPSTN